MKVLVTGASGFIGGALTKRLLSKGVSVRALVRDPDPASWLKDTGAEIFKGDVTYPASCNMACQDIDVVYHCAGVLGGWGKPESIFWKMNYEGTKNMLEAAKKEDVKKFVHVSSCGVFGPMQKNQSQNSIIYNPTNIYEKTKAEAEKLVFEFNKQGLPVVVVRPEFVYGPGDLHLLPFFRAVKNGRFFFFDGGTSLLHPTYIDDVIDGGLLAAENQNVIGKGFNLAGKKPISVEELVSSMCTAMEVQKPRISVPTWAAYAAATLLEYSWGLLSKPPLTRSQVEFLSQSRYSDSLEAEEAIGYSPKTNLQNGISKTVAWYKKNKLL